MLAGVFLCENFGSRNEFTIDVVHGSHRLQVRIVEPQDFEGFRQ